MIDTLLAAAAGAPGIVPDSSTSTIAVDLRLTAGVDARDDANV